MHFDHHSSVSYEESSLVRANFWRDYLILSLLAKDILAPALHIAALAQLKVLLETKMVL